MNESLKYFSKALKTREKNVHEKFDKWLLNSRNRKISEIANFLSLRSSLVDITLKELWQELELSSEKNMALFAVGGYGRGQLHPFSDIDLLILSNSTLNKSQKNKIENFISSLWDLGLDIGHSVRTIEESKKYAKEDVRNMTNMLESRLIYGSSKVNKKLSSMVNQANLWGGSTFFKTKLIEQEERHQKFDNTEYNLEPDIKSSPGGLRDIHTINWLLLNYSREKISSKLDIKRILTKQEKRELKKSEYWLSTIRYLLHKQSKREEDRLLFELQLSTAKQLFPKMKEGQASAEKLMRRYYRAALNISEINASVIQVFKEKLILNKRKGRTRKIDNHFSQRRDFIKLQNLRSFKKNPSLILDIFVKLCENPSLKGIESETLRQLKEDSSLIDPFFRKKKKNIDLFMKVIRSDRLMVTQLERMKQLGILGRYLPEFGRITGQMQYDLFHIYTVDAHTLQVLRNMRRLLLGTTKNLFPLASKIVKTLTKLEVLYIAGLFHDIGKGRGKNHSILGARAVKRFCNNHGLEDKEKKLIEWLVLNHLKMSVTSQKEDLSNIEVIKKFSLLVKNRSRLNYLYCLTVADISATNPTLWNSWNESLLNELYFKTVNYLNPKGAAKEIYSSREVKNNALDILMNRYQVKPKEINKLWKDFYSNYFEAFESNSIALHGSLLISQKQGKTFSKIIGKEHSSNIELFVYTKDRSNVFATIVNQLDIENINILDARLFGTKNGYCLDFIKISSVEEVPLMQNKDKIKRLQKSLSIELSKNKLEPKFIKKRIPRKLKHFKKDTEIKIRHDMKYRWTQLDLVTADRPGLLASVCKVFIENNASIKKARISTYGERAEDRFCITSPEETPFLKKKDLDQLIKGIKSSLDG